MKLFRWRAIAPLTLILGLLVAGWLLLGDWLVRRAAEDGASLALGTEVDIGWLRVSLSQAAVELRGLEVADPFNPSRNLLEAGRIVLDVDPVPLLEKKVVIDRMVLTGLRFGNARRRPARPVASGDGAAARILAEVKDWGQQFKAPLLSLTPIDTLKAIALDPAKLGTIRAAETLAARTDSTRRSLERGLQALKIDPVVDSANALAGRLAATSPGKLGVAGTSEAVTAVKRMLDQVNQAKQQLATLQSGVTGAAALLGDGLKELEEARRQDYAFARSLLKLPGLDAPDIGAALFGAPSAGVFQEGLYYGRVAQQYIPPGLQPWRKTGPKRLRMRGTTVIFPKEHAYPSFLLRQGQLGFSLGADTTKGSFSGSIAGLTTQPALYGKPTSLTARGSVSGATPMAVHLDGLLDHVRATPRDSVALSVEGLPLPSFDLPSLPFRVSPGVGATALSFALDGDRVAARLNVRSSAVTWTADSARMRELSSVERAVWQVVSGLRDLDLRANLSGTLTAPRLAVGSNLDQAVADRLKSLVGEQVARGEARVRAEVDRLVEAKVEPVRRQVAAVQTELAGRLGVQQQSLNEAQQRLEAELKRLGGLSGLPKIKLP